jgi:hypothetical protein
MESTALFFRGLVGHYMMFGERLSSFNLYLRAIFERYTYQRLCDKRSLLDYFMASGGYEKSDVRFLVVFFIRTVLTAGRYPSELISP